MIVDRKPSPTARKLLLDGELLEVTETLALKLAHGYDFAKRMIQEISLIIAGQSIKFLDIGLPDRGFSHAAFYGAHGYGRDFTWRIAETSGIFPINDPIRAKRLDNITEAALIGTVEEYHILPPPTVTEDILFVGEYATLAKGQNAEGMAANLCSMLETGEYHRRLAKVVKLREILDDPNDRRRKRLVGDIEECKHMGMHIDVNRGAIRVDTTTSWIISSARFGSEVVQGRPLLSMGDVDRYRWRSFSPTREERLKVTSEVGSLPPVDINATEISAVNEAWRILHTTLKEMTATRSIKVPRDDMSYQLRKRIWDDTQKEMLELYPDMKDIYEDQLVTLRATAEFRRLMYQHAALKQFARNQGHDFAEPGKFVIDYEEDGEFAKQLWLTEYVPSLMEVVDDILHSSLLRRSRTVTFSEKGSEVVLKRLEEGSAAHDELVEVAADAGIKKSLLSNVVLPTLLKKDLICKPTGYKVYQLRDCKICKMRDVCRYRDM